MKFYYLLYPRSAVIIGSGSFNNKEINFMTVAWTTPISEEPPTVGFSSYIENYSNTLIEKYGQFSIIITKDTDLLLKLGSISGKEKDKVKYFNLEVVSGKKLDVPILKNNLGFLECKLIDKKEIGECNFYIGEVLYWEAKNIDKYGWKDMKEVPLHIGGKRFSFIKD